MKNINKTLPLTFSRRMTMSTTTILPLFKTFNRAKLLLFKPLLAILKGTSTVADLGANISLKFE